MHDCVQREEMSERIEPLSLTDDRIRHGFTASFNNYLSDRCSLFFQSAIAFVSNLPYSHSIHKILQYCLLFPFTSACSMSSPSKTPAPIPFSATFNSSCPSAANSPFSVYSATESTGPWKI